MKRLFIFTFTVLVALAVAAQKPKQEMKHNLRLSASNFLAYPGPKPGKLTPAPKGTAPFYISHYGRHGSRYMTTKKEYDYAYDILLHADSLGKLSFLGHDLLGRIAIIRQEAENRYGELTPLGAEQLRDIARRMMERFPEVFEDDATIDARSTIFTRTILSMNNAVLQLMSMNPRLRISVDASQRDRGYLHHIDLPLTSMIRSAKALNIFNDFSREHQCWERPMAALFNDTAYLHHEVDGELLNRFIFRMASNLQNTESRKKTTLYDLYTDEEIYENWLVQNAFWFMGYGFTNINGNLQPFTQRYLLRQIINETDSCLQHPHPGASLRFGHDTVLLPLVCLLGINGYDQTIDDPRQLVRKGWVDYRVFPMACNLQFVFYRKAPDDTDVLFKALLNENEATLPLPDKQAPYYRWADFREHYLRLLDSYVEPAVAAQQTDFVKGADVGFLSRQEQRGIKFHDRNGRERECLELLHNDYQINAIRLRVWVNPKDGECNKYEVLAMAQRAKKLGMEVMIDFHYADSWADPGKQPTPKDWQGHNYKQLQQDVKQHTIDVLTLLKQNNIEPRWVQVGNETSNGLLWPEGHIEQHPDQYAGLIDAAYDAVKAVLPNTTVIVHLDRGHDSRLYDYNLGILRQYGARFDMVGMSLYPYWAMEGHPELQADQVISDCISNICHVNETFGCDVMIVETGFEVDEQHPEKMTEGRRQLSRVIREARNHTGGHCRGVFYWEPQCLPGGYRLGAFDSSATPTAIMDAFIE